MKHLFALPSFVLWTTLIAFGCASTTAPTPQDTAGGDTSPAVDTAAPADTTAAPDTAVSPEDTAGPTEPYTITVFDQERINSTGDVNVRNITADVDFAGHPFASVIMTVSLGSTCYPFDQWTQPPAGHNWPADCDAFDRNFEFTMDDPKEEGDPPAFELVRAITPFGGPLQFEVDITDLANARPGAHTIRAHISTWSDGAGQVTGSAGGWTVSASIAVTPGKAPRNVLAAIPLFNHMHGKLEEPAKATFTLPEGTVGAILEYRVTGHGGGDATSGCIGPAEEFCKRQHDLWVDGEVLDSIIPWRDDCASLCTLTPHPNGFDYCLENPCGSIQSVKAPRANWCPGSVTPPVTWIPQSYNGPGEHTFSYDIPNQADGSWRVSAVVYAYGP